MFNSLYFFICAPRSGKSTLAKKWERYQWFHEEHLKPLNYGLYNFGCPTDCGRYKDANPRVVVNADTIRIALHGQRFDASRETEVNDYKWMMIRTYLMQGYDVLIDGTHTSHNSIWKVLNIREQAIPIFLGTPYETCIERAYASGQPDLDEKGIIKTMFNNLGHVWSLYADKDKKDQLDIADFPEWNKIIRKMGDLVHQQKLKAIREDQERSDDV